MSIYILQVQTMILSKNPMAILDVYPTNEVDIYVDISLHVYPPFFVLETTCISSMSIYSTSSYVPYKYSYHVKKKEGYNMKKILLSLATMIIVALGAAAPVMAEENTWPEETYTNDDSYMTRQAELDEKMEEYCRENGKMTPSEIRRATASIGTIHSAVYTLFPFGVGMALVAGALGLAAHFIKVQKYRDEKRKDAFSNASSTGKQYKDATQDGIKDATQDDVAMIIQLMQGAEKTDNDTFNQYHF